MNEKQWQRIAVGAGAGMFLGMALGRFSYSAMIPALVDSGNLDAVTAGYIGGVNMVGFLAGAAASTLAVKCLRLDRVLFASVLIAVAALAASALPWGPIWLGAWRAAIGVATGCIMVLGLAVTAQSAPPEHRARAMSYIFIGVGSGILFGATIVPASLKVSIAAAWLAVSFAGIIAAAIALWCWRDVASAISNPGEHHEQPHPRARAAWYAIVAASFLFSFGIVPHTIYWFDYIARGLGHGYGIAGWHWTGVGIWAILGPVLAAWLARVAGTSFAAAVAYFVMAAGVALPWLTHAGPALVLSSIIFGAQPGVSTLLGARARDLGTADEMPAMMRTIILANGIGSAIAGITVPMLLDLTGSYELLFLTGGIALACGGFLCLPAIARTPSRA
jgi:predicted MFS family arabinose efflux permease